MIGVTNGEGVRQGVIERQVRAGEMAHGQGPLGRDPGVVVLPARVRALPAVVQAKHGLSAGLFAVQPERGHAPLPALLRLPEHRLAVREGDGPRVAEPAHAAQGPEIVVEAAVFLHQDHHVLHVLDRAGDLTRGDRQRASDGRRQGCRAQRRAGRELEKSQAIAWLIRHDDGPHAPRRRGPAPHCPQFLTGERRPAKHHASKRRAAKPASQA